MNCAGRSPTRKIIRRWPRLRVTHHEGAHVCVVAGYWGSVKKWKRFESRWKTILADADEPSLTEFHSVNFWHSNGDRKGVFAKWRDEKATQFIDDLANCIVASDLFPTSAVLGAALLNGSGYCRLPPRIRCMFQRSLQSRREDVSNRRHLRSQNRQMVGAMFTARQ